MILADTSVWVEHLRHGLRSLSAALHDEQVLMHPFIVGELACGNLRNRSELLALLERLPFAASASDAEALAFIETRRLMGRGIGYVDVHLLASTSLSPAARLWTHDRRLAAVAAKLGLEHRASS
ncbi:MAG TPA: type II toxin-antitoxin system VapC family toxin [Gemmatimonadaceae bacterium]